MNMETRQWSVISTGTLEPSSSFDIARVVAPYFRGPINEEEENPF
jgi:hypothetical protein